MKFFKSATNGAESRITFYDGIDRAENGKKLSAATIKRSTKQTVNLCKREKKGMSFAMFCLMLFLILAVLIVVEYFAAYRPYSQMEAKQQELSEKQDRLDDLNGAMSDRLQIQEEYRKYNYANFPFEIIDREDILNLIKDKIFPYGNISSVYVANNVLSLTIETVDPVSIETMVAGLDANGEDSLVQLVTWSRTNVESEAVAEVSMTITFKDASQGGN